MIFKLFFFLSNYFFCSRSLSLALIKINANSVTNDYLYKSIARLVVSIKFTFVQIISFLIDIENVAMKKCNQLTSFSGLYSKKINTARTVSESQCTGKTMNSTLVEYDNRQMKKKKKYANFHQSSIRIWTLSFSLLCVSVPVFAIPNSIEKNKSVVTINWIWSHFHGIALQNTVDKW